MRKIDFCTIFFLFFLLLFNLASASVGIGIAPATGSYEFTLDGGTIEFTIYNTGSEDAVYRGVVSDEAADFTTIEPKESEVKANSYATFTATINPNRNVEAGDIYKLTVTATAASGGNMNVEAKSNIDLNFYGERTKPYLEKTLPETKIKPKEIFPAKPIQPTTMATAKTQLEPISIILIFVIVILIITYVVYFRKKKK